MDNNGQVQEAMVTRGLDKLNAILPPHCRDFSTYDWQPPCGKNVSAICTPCN